MPDNIHPYSLIFTSSLFYPFEKEWEIPNWIYIFISKFDLAHWEVNNSNILLKKAFRAHNITNMVLWFWFSFTGDIAWLAPWTYKYTVLARQKKCLCPLKFRYHDRLCIEYLCRQCAIGKWQMWNLQVWTCLFHIAQWGWCIRNSSREFVARCVKPFLFLFSNGTDTILISLSPCVVWLRSRSLLFILDSAGERDGAKVTPCPTSTEPWVCECKHQVSSGNSTVPKFSHGTSIKES